MTTRHNPVPEWARTIGGGLTAGQRIVRFNRSVWQARVHPKRLAESRYRAEARRRRYLS
jgi:hypothetical protein